MQHNSDPKSTVVAVVGPSGVGKTTLLERLIPRLASNGLAVGVIKHASHGFEVDRPGKDSHRLYQSGAKAVGLVSEDQVVTFKRRGTGPLLEEALSLLPPGLDIVLAEGFSWEPIPRILLLPQGWDQESRGEQAAEPLSVVRVPAGPGGQKPVFSESLVGSLVRMLLALVPGGGRLGAETAVEQGSSAAREPSA